MVGKTKSRTKDQQRRFDALKEMGCFIFRHKLGLGWRLPDIHHILSGGKRISHDHTIPLDPWFHEGHPPQGMTAKDAYETFGPSLKRHKREFVREFGAEKALLKEVDEKLKKEGAI